MPDHTLSATVRQEFIDRFGAEPRLFRAPGRVNLIGEHTDYNEGFVMPAAIVFETVVAAAQRADRILEVLSLNFDQSREFSLDSPPQPAHDWSDYVLGVALALEQAGQKLSGVNLVIEGNVPLGAGLSSSASVEVATAIAFCGLSGIRLSKQATAQLCQRAENDFVGAPCGIMDQFISLHGRGGHALKLDCHSLEFELTPLPPAVDIVICNSMVKHSIATGEYGVRRAQCEEAVRKLRAVLPGIQSLRDVSLRDLERHQGLLSEVVCRRARHVLTENERVEGFAAAMRWGNIKLIGALMAASHRSMRYDYEVTCPEVDAMVEIAVSLPGVIGSRMTGGGFGGCVVNLVHREESARFREEVARAYEAKTGIKPEIYVTQAADGAGEIKSER